MVLLYDFIMFFGTSILDGFWEGFGRPKSMIFGVFFETKTEAKNKKIFGRVKNHILRPNNKFIPNFWVGLAVRAGPGGGIKGWGKALGPGIWALHLKLTLEAGS